MQMKKIIYSLIISLLCVVQVAAHEGMWLPILLDVDAMQREGLKMSAEDIYSVNNASLKDAIVHFGGGCTAEAISDEGLILTNHHCGYSAIQNLSSVENDYLKDGFWAGSQEEELACPGLTASFIVRIADVTSAVLAGVDDQTDPKARQKWITTRSASIVDSVAVGAGISAEVKPFYYGNQYILIIKKTYSDVRLVGAPPSSIGKFGGDTDNWVWPRHTGDFSMFRIYADADNEPAEYGDSNRPYVPARSLDISIKGVKNGDFTMVYGFPGRTSNYMTSNGMAYVSEVVNPLRIEMREQSLSVIDAAMAQSDELRIKYAARQSTISNAYKKWIGQNMGLERFDALEKKRAEEAAFIDKAGDAHLDRYAKALADVQKLHEAIRPYQLARDLFIEFYFYGPEILNFTRQLDALIAALKAGEPEETLEPLRAKAVAAAKGHFKDYDASIDRQIFSKLTGLYAASVQPDLKPDALADFEERFKGKGSAFAEDIYEKSVFDDAAELIDILQNGKAKKVLKLEKDPAYVLSNSFLTSYGAAVRPSYDSLQTLINVGMQVYMEGLMQLNPEKHYWSEANSTLRVTYGKVEGCIPRDGMAYLPHTTLDGIIQKYIPGDKEFDVPEKLLRLHADQDYGRYGNGDELNVAFLASNHTTGGNSGSPVLNAEGQLIGLNFDRSWESTMSDLMFSPEICRNISVDIRYILFIVDKYAEANWLIDEMNIIE